MSGDEWDLIVVGAGGAGLSAAASAAERGGRVLVLEAEDAVGGSMSLAAGMFTAAGTRVQEALGVEDSPDRFFQHYMDLNQWRLQPGLIRTFCEATAPTLHWMMDLGLEVPAQRSTNAHMPGLGHAGVEDVWRGHTPAGEGFAVVELLERTMRTHGAELALGARVDGLVVEGGRVCGVRVGGEEARAGAVVVASGGFAHDRDLVDRYFPAARAAGEHLFVVAGAGSRGDHLRLAEQVGAGLTGQGWGLLLVTAYLQRHHHWDSGFPPLSRINVNSTGQRFMDEDVSYAVSAGILADQEGPCWMVFDEAARLSLPEGFLDWTPERVHEEAEAGRTHRADDLAALAAAIGVPGSTFVRTVERWNQTLPHGLDPEFQRHLTLAAKGVATPLTELGTPPFYAALLVPGELVCTHTGLRIDSRARVLDVRGDVVAGLYAAGEAGGGVLGNRYVGGGNAIANSLTLGRIAGLDGLEHAGRSA
ncbi:FAD-dependent oxidoreductase [Ornithinimicrobium cavernae]|uniref:FAD-dependent oxidoreductase n=1 Tax=Ornithinimicrobium cavernae TaxID=2666047 RepID=UPI000D68C0B6|nr:FAD-dependent oxidoreductase [Ornithinimicrobium cavernae]